MTEKQYRRAQELHLKFAEDLAEEFCSIAGAASAARVRGFGILPVSWGYHDR